MILLWLNFCLEKEILVMKEKEHVGLLVAEKRTETRDGLSMPMNHVTQRKNISRQMPQMCH